MTTAASCGAPVDRVKRFNSCRESRCRSGSAHSIVQKAFIKNLSRARGVVARDCFMRLQTRGRSSVNQLDAALCSEIAALPHHRIGQQFGGGPAHTDDRTQLRRVVQRSRDATAGRHRVAHQHPIGDGRIDQLVQLFGQLTTQRPPTCSLKKSADTTAILTRRDPFFIRSVFELSARMKSSPRRRLITYP